MHAETLQQNNAPSQDIKSKWKSDLTSKLNAFCRVAKNYNAALAEADAYLDGHSSKLSLYNKLQPIVKSWLKDICQQANSETDNISHIKITTENLPYDLTGFDFPRARGFYDPDPLLKNKMSFYDAPDIELAKWAINNFDFVALEAAISKAKSEIESLGLASTANSLASEFGLLWRGHMSEEKEIKQQKGRYIIEYSHYGSWVHDRTRALESLKVNARTFENEAEAYGLVFCIQMLINAENALPQSFDCSVPSRTKVAEDSAVSATFFKDKIKFFFEPSIFEALISFINEYKGANTELANLKLV